MSSVVKKLQYLDFPQCTREALDYLVSCFTQTSGGIPGLGGGAENYAMEVSQQYIINIHKSRGRHKNMQKLTALQELQLLEMVCTSLQAAPEETRFSIFSVIFGGKADPHKAGLLTKLVSMAISTGCSAVLGCAALWMQEQGSQSQAVCDLAKTLVEDYCLLFPNISSTFQNMPKVSPLFTCNFITAVSTIYTFTGKGTIAPAGLVEYITDWVSSDPCLCCESVRLIRIRSNFTSPIFGLVRWCVLGPLLIQSKQSTKGPTDKPYLTDDSRDGSNDGHMLELFSRLHLGLLLTLQAYKSMELNQELLTYPDIYVLAKTVSSWVKHSMNSEEQESSVHTAVDRLAQLIQVAMVTGSLNPKVDLRQIYDMLPPNRLLQIIGQRTGGGGNIPMDVS